jgi:hypothetical protein
MAAALPANMLCEISENLMLWPKAPAPGGQRGPRGDTISLQHYQDGHVGFVQQRMNVALGRLVSGGNPMTEAAAIDYLRIQAAETRIWGAPSEWRCCHCGKMFPAEAFHKNASKKLGLHNLCRECNVASVAAYRAKRRLKTKNRTDA